MVTPNERTYASMHVSICVIASYSPLSIVYMMHVHGLTTMHHLIYYYLLNLKVAEQTEMDDAV